MSGASLWETTIAIPAGWRHMPQFQNPFPVTGRREKRDILAQQGGRVSPSTKSFLQDTALNVQRGNIVHEPMTEVTLTTEVLLTHDEQKAAEAAFRGLPMNPRWSRNAQESYLRILEVTHGRNIVADTDTPPPRRRSRT